MFHNLLKHLNIKRMLHPHVLSSSYTTYDIDKMLLRSLSINRSILVLLKIPIIKLNYDNITEGKLLAFSPLYPI